MGLWTGKSQPGFRKLLADFVWRSYSIKASLCIPNLKSTTRHPVAKLVFPFSQTLAERRVFPEKLRNHKTGPTYLNVDTESMMASMHSSLSCSSLDRSALTSSLCVMGRRQSLWMISRLMNSLDDTQAMPGEYRSPDNKHKTGDEFGLNSMKFSDKPFFH